MRKILLEKIRNQKGATLIVVGLSLVALIGFAALAIDVGYLYAARNELQNIADASALAGARKLGVIYKSLTDEEQRNFICDKSVIMAVVKDIAFKNKAAGKSIIVSDDDVVIGKWVEWKALAPGVPKADNLTHPDAVHVTARRDDLANGPVATFFAKVLNIDTVNVSAAATAALSGKSTAGPGEMKVPVGISSFWFTKPEYCNDHIKFSPTNDPDACAAWNTFNYTPSNDNRVGKILEEDPAYPSPRTTVDETTYSFIGGDLSTPTFDAMLDLFQKYGYDVDAEGNPILDPVTGEPMSDATGYGGIPLTDSTGAQLYYNNGTPRNIHNWPTYVVVYDWDDCSNANKPIKIVGFAKINITDVLGAPDKLIEGVVLCDYIDPNDTRGGGGDYGLKGSIPGLVE